LDKEEELKSKLCVTAPDPETQKEHCAMYLGKEKWNNVTLLFHY
jgi:hypothetical protein